jgi:hypothetical protein
MSWNHRVWLGGAGDDTVYGIHETYYNDAGEVCFSTMDSVAPVGDSLEELRECLVRMLKACDEALKDSSNVLVEDGFIYSRFGDSV